MSNGDNNPFPSSEQVARALVEELRQLRAELREATARLTRMERRVYVCFPKLAPVKQQKSGSDNAGQKSSTISREEALKLFDGMVGLATSGQEVQLSRQMDELDLPVLRGIARELGVSLGKKKPTRKTLREAVVGRVKESVLLSRHVSRPIEQTQETTNPEAENL